VNLKSKFLENILYFNIEIMTITPQQIKELREITGI
jgi:hypothetical protein